jgi:hypothetical protein
VNRSKAKGTAAESAVVATLVEQGWPHAERRALSGNTDKGDVAGVIGVCIEVKSEASYDIPGWLRETATEKTNANADVGACWFKLRGKTNPRDWAVVMTGAQFIDLLREAGYHPGGTKGQP